MSEGNQFDAACCAQDVLLLAQQTPQHDWTSDSAGLLPCTRYQGNSSRHICAGMQVAYSLVAGGQQPPVHTLLCAAQACCRPPSRRTRRDCTPERRCQAPVCCAAGGVQSMLAREGVLWSRGVLSAPRVSAAACAPEARCVCCSLRFCIRQQLISLVTQTSLGGVSSTALSSCGLRSADLVAPQ